MDVLDGVPKRVLGYEMKSRYTIIFTFLVPASLELIAYLIQILADIGVTIQLFRDKDDLYACLTLILVVLPPFVTFTAIITSPWQWPESTKCNAENCRFFLRQLVNMLLFPIGTVVRFCRRIFWSVEALFHEEDSYERHHSMLKAAETSPFELYGFLQAYLQAAPQVILQLFVLLKKDTFRNYETTNVQVLSIVFSLVNIAVITMSYQRFESQKIVGRHYPWSTNQYVQHRRQKFRRTRSLTEELMKSKKRSAEITRTFPETEHIMQRFHSQLLQEKQRPGSQITENRASSNIQRPETVRGSLNLTASQKYAGKTVDSTVGVDELDVSRRRSIPESEWSTIESASADEYSEYNSYLRRKLSASQIRIQSMGFDSAPDIPPPKPPTNSRVGSGEANRMSLNPLNRVSQLTDRLVYNVGMYFKENVPHPPRILIERVLSQDERDKASSQAGGHNANDIMRGSHSSQIPNPRTESSLARDNISHQTSAQFQRSSAISGRARDEPSSSAGVTRNGGDELDFFLPSRKKMIEGVEQDDFAGKFVSFFGWILFIYMRMMSLSVFCAFYPMEFLYLIGAHYGLMLLCLAIESRLKDKCERIVFYFCLAYIYIFVILEFKIKFRHVRRIYIGYFLLVLLENFIITIIWYGSSEFYAWIYEYLFVTTMMCGVLTLMCMIVYYLILRPDDLILFEEITEP